MSKKVLFVLVTISCIFSTIALITVVSRRFPDSRGLQTAVANSEVSVKVKAGTLSFTKSPAPSVTAVDASPDNQTTTGTLGAMEVTDLRGAKGTGWTVNIDAMTNYQNGDKSESIPMTNTELNMKNLVVSKGDPAFVSITNGTLKPVDQNNDGALDSAVTLAQTLGVVNAKKYNGINVAQFQTDINLTVPGGLPADTYTSSYTISVQ